MTTETPHPGRVQFGVFEVDLRSGELRKSGRKVHLAGQPFDLLALLLERPGEVVTREELREQLWPRDVFVDFDQSLNKAVNSAGSNERAMAWPTWRSSKARSRRPLRTAK